MSNGAVDLLACIKSDFISQHDIGFNIPKEGVSNVVSDVYESKNRLIWTIPEYRAPDTLKNTQKSSHIVLMRSNLRDGIILADSDK